MDPRVAIRLDRLAGQPVYALHRGVYQATGGRVGGRFQGLDILLLTTTGRRTGRRRTKPLVYVRDGDDLVVVASNAGRPNHPCWYLNLLTDPRAEVRIGSARVPVLAHPASEAEAARLWPGLHARYAGFAAYQARTSRLIPPVVLAVP